MSSILSPGNRVSHANACRSYGAGEITSIVPVPGGIRPPSKGYVRFDGDRAPRLVWLDDLTLIVTPAPMPGSEGALRLCWPLERAGEPVLPVVA